MKTGLRLDLLVFFSGAMINLCAGISPNHPLPQFLMRYGSTRGTFLVVVWMVCLAAILSAVGVVLFRCYRQDHGINAIGDRVFGLSRSFSSSVLIMILFVIFCGILLIVFPPSHFDQMIYHGDFPYQYMVGERGLSFLEHGTMFPWEPHFLGGYPSFLDFSKDTSLFLYPLTIILSFPLAFHCLMILSLLFLPVSFTFWCAALRFPKDRIRKSLVFFLMVLICNERTLTNGMLTAVIGLDLFFLAGGLIVYSASRRSWLSLSLSLPVLMVLCHIHTSFFLFCLLVSIPLCLTGDGGLASGRRFVLYGFFLSAIVFPYVSGALQNLGVSMSSSKLFEEGFVFGLTQFVTRSLCFWDLTSWGAYGLFLLIAISLLFSPRDGIDNPLLLRIGWFIFLLTAVRTTETIGFALSRNDYILLPLIAVMLTTLMRDLSVKRRLIFQLLAGLVMLQTFMPFPKPLAHCDRSYFQPLIESMSGPADERVLAENAARWPAALAPSDTEKAELPHYVPYLQMTSDRVFLSNPGADPYHYSTFRMNTITSGTFRGIPFASVDKRDMVTHCIKWRVRWIVTWSGVVTTWFHRHEELFTFIRRARGLSLFRFTGELPPDPIVYGSGTGKIIGTDFGRIHLRLNEVHRNNLVLLAVNYARNWLAHDEEGNKIGLFSYGGQLAFRCPGEGDQSITLTYPTLSRQFVISLLFIIISPLVFAMVLRRDPLHVHKKPSESL